MRKLLSFVLFLFVFTLTSVLPAYARVQLPGNPVHEQRKKNDEKNRQVFRGQRIVEDEAQKQKDAVKKSDSGDLKDKDKRDKARLTELMKKFDQDGDGVISYEEMEAAKAAGKDKELKALLAKEKTGKKKQKAKDDVGKKLQDKEEQKESNQEGGANKVVVVPPQN